MTSHQHNLAQQAQEPAAAWLVFQKRRVPQQMPLAMCAPAHSQVCHSLRSLSTMSTGAMMSPGCPTQGTAADRSGTSSTSPTGARPDDSTTCAGHKHSGSKRTVRCRSKIASVVQVAARLLLLRLSTARRCAMCCWRWRYCTAGSCTTTKPPDHPPRQQRQAAPCRPL